MYKITAHLGRREMKVWHFPEQDCDIVMCHFLRLHYTKVRSIILRKMRSIFPIFRNFQGNYPDFPQKLTPKLPSRLWQQWCWAWTRGWYTFTHAPPYIWLALSNNEYRFNNIHWVFVGKQSARLLTHIHTRAHKHTRTHTYTHIHTHEHSAVQYGGIWGFTLN